MTRSASAIARSLTRQLRVWRRRFHEFVTKQRHEEDLKAEIEANLGFQIEDNIRAGMSQEEARRAAFLKFGNVEGVKERVRDRRGIPFLEALIQDIRVAVRRLGQSRGWTAVAVLSLGIGIGANSAVFSAVNELFLKSLPVLEPNRLVRLKWVGANDMATSLGDYGYSGTDASGHDIHGSFSYAMYESVRKNNHTLAGLFAFCPMGNLNVVVDGHADVAWGLVVAGDYFNVLGLHPVLGRAITPDDDQVSAPPVAVISDAYWKRRFGGDPSVIGKVASVTGVPVTIVGVTPPGFNGVQRLGDSSPPDITLPLAQEPQFSIFRNRVRNDPSTWWLYLVGRLKPGVTAPQVEGNLNGPFQQAAREGWASYFRSLSPEAQARNANRNAVPELRVDGGGHGFYEIPPDTVRIVTLLSVVCGVILLIVCANIANLLLSRAATRQRELSLRLSIGATRARLIQQLLTESIVLATFGGCLGIPFGYWTRKLLPADIGQSMGLDLTTFAFTAGVAVAAGLLFGIAPAFRSTRRQLVAGLNTSNRNFSGPRTTLSKLLIVLQVAASVALLVEAGLLLRTLGNLRTADNGFDSNNVLVFRLNPLLNRYDQTRAAHLYEDVVRELQAVPGIRSASASDMWLLTGGQIIANIRVAGRTPGERDQVHNLLVGPKFFDTLGIALLRGRDFTEADKVGTPKVAIVNEAAVRKYFADQNPVGRTIDLESNRGIEIVGIVRDVKFSNVRTPAPPTVYLPFLQDRIGSMNFEVRTSVNPASLMSAVRDVIRHIDADLPVLNMSLYENEIEGGFAQERFLALAYSIVGMLGATLASIGLFGVISYSVVRRTREIGIRVAVGARARDVTQMILRESLVLVVIGIACGIAGASAASRLIATLLFEVAGTDFLTLSAVCALMMFVATVAALLPARKAARVDPMTALRCE